MKMVQDIIIKPIITEASMDKLAEKKYTFKVASDAKRLGVHFGYTSDWKKAVVTLTADSKTIEFFDGLN